MQKSNPYQSDKKGLLLGLAKNSGNVRWIAHLLITCLLLT